MVTFQKKKSNKIRFPEIKDNERQIGRVTYDHYLEWLDTEPKEAMKRELALNGDYEGAIRTESFLLWYKEKYKLTPETFVNI